MDILQIKVKKATFLLVIQNLVYQSLIKFQEVTSKKVLRSIIHVILFFLFKFI